MAIDTTGVRKAWPAADLTGQFGQNVERASGLNSSVRQDLPALSEQHGNARNTCSLMFLSIRDGQSMAPQMDEFLSWNDRETKCESYWRVYRCRIAFIFLILIDT
jgi:hypothetical protein